MIPFILSLALALAFLPWGICSIRKRRLGNARYFIFTIILASIAVIVPVITPVGTDQLWSFPQIPGLDEYIRLFSIHVPLAWVSVLAFAFSVIYSVAYLKNGNNTSAVVAHASVKYGTIFCILATVTGMIWAKHSWGTWWNWDPRQTSIAFLLLIYCTYFALRAAITATKTKARISSVYAILSGLTVPFFIFMLPRLTGGLHPGSGSSSPVAGGSILDSSLLYAFALSLYAMTSLFLVLIDRQKDIK
ncbi:MAG: cytochrome c biogenesis protein CcsA [Candidatus Kapabacteria bacterium]|nr:cytochrome c biogenesis protein CcsA [Candidatus Kapabacteria bacterium]